MALLIRFLKIPGKIECLVPNNQGYVQQPVEGSYLMVQYPGKAPEPYCRVVADNMRHVFERFDDEKPGKCQYIHYLYILTPIPKIPYANSARGPESQPWIGNDFSRWTVCSYLIEVIL